MIRAQTMTDELKTGAYTLDEKLWTKGRNVIVFLLMVTWIASLFGAFTDRVQFLHSYLNAPNRLAIQVTISRKTITFRPLVHSFSSSV